MIVLDQDAVDWHIVHEAVSDAINNAEGTPNGNDLQRAFKTHGLIVIHEEDAGIVPEREAAWLIERTCSPPQYVTEHTTQPGFSSDPWRAVRFKTEREAFDFRLRLTTMRDECQVIEHMFINRPYGSLCRAFHARTEAGNVEASDIVKRCYEFPEERHAREHRVRLLAERYLAMTEKD